MGYCLAYLGDPPAYRIEPTVSASDTLATDDREVVVASLFERNLGRYKGVLDDGVRFPFVAFALYATAVATSYNPYDLPSVYSVPAVLVGVGDLSVASSAVHLGLPLASVPFAFPIDSIP